MSPQLIFGTGTLGIDEVAFKDASSVSSLLKLLKSLGVKRIDSSARYPGPHPGRAEELLGQCKAESVDFTIDTKIFTDVTTDGSSDLSKAKIETSINGSLSRLRRTSQGVNILSPSRADPSTPVREQVQAFIDQTRKGHCRAWGLSNVSIEVVKEILRVCEEEGLQKPACLQGQYNIISRGAEAELLPLLRQHGMALNGYAPLAAGFMTGNAVKGEQAGTRFDAAHPMGKAIEARYELQGLRKPMEEFLQSVTEHGLEAKEVAIRWIYYHSALGDQDGIIFGASKEQQVTGLMDMIQRGPLPEGIIQSADRLWEGVKETRNQWM